MFLCSRLARVHRLYPTELITGFQVFGDAFGLGELGGNEFDLFIGLMVDIDKVLRQSALHQHQREGVGLILLEKLLPHPSKTADVLGRPGRKCEVGEVIVAVFGVGYFHDCILLYDFMNSLMGSCAASSRPIAIPARDGTVISNAPIMSS